MSLTWNEAANKWEGGGLTPQDAHLVVTRYSELPDPSTVNLGTVAVVHSDPDDRLNGLHVSHGQYWKSG